MAVRSGTYLPIDGEFGDVRRLVALCVQAERSGWDGFFIWDLVHSGLEPMVDPWVVLSACAAKTSRITLGTLVTPVARRRPVKLARELLSLDQLSGGRAILGVGLGLGYEFRLLGEPDSVEARNQRFTDGMVLLDRLLHGDDSAMPSSGAEAHLNLGPRPINGRIPLWLGMFEDGIHGPQRAARVPITGIIPMRRNFDIHRLLTAKELGALVQAVADAGARVEEVATFGRQRNPECQPLGEYVEVGMTWWLEVFHADADSVQEVEETIRRGPPRW